PTGSCSVPPTGSVAPNSAGVSVSPAGVPSKDSPDSTPTGSMTSEPAASISMCVVLLESESFAQLLYEERKFVHSATSQRCAKFPDGSGGAGRHHFRDGTHGDAARCDVVDDVAEVRG